MITNSNYKVKIRKRLKLAFGVKRTYTTNEMFRVIYDDGLESLKALAGPKRFKEQKEEIEFQLRGFTNSVIMDWDKEK